MSSHQHHTCSYSPWRVRLTFNWGLTQCRSWGKPCLANYLLWERQGEKERYQYHQHSWNRGVRVGGMPWAWSLAGVAVKNSTLYDSEGRLLWCSLGLACCNATVCKAELVLDVSNPQSTVYILGTWLWSTQLSFSRACWGEGFWEDDSLEENLHHPLTPIGLCLQSHVPGVIDGLEGTGFTIFLK